jgi:hypothetical protein
MTDDFDRIRRFTDNPGTRALSSMAAIAGFFPYAGKLLSSPEGRRGYWGQVRQAAAERRDRDRWHERRNQRYRAKQAYFDGPGGAIYRQRAEIGIGPEKPFPGAIYERLPGRFRGSHFKVTSASPGASIDVSWDVADRDGALKLILADGRSWSFGFFARNTELRQDRYEGVVHDFELARIACRLLATPGSPFSTITFVRPEARQIHEQIWEDHVAEHPELAQEDWPL